MFQASCKSVQDQSFHGVGREQDHANMCYLLLLVDEPNESQKEAFMFEIEQMKLLGSHPNIVSMVGCCTLQEPKFLVIEYVPCGDLLKWLRGRRRLVGNV